MTIKASEETEEGPGDAERSYTERSYAEWSCAEFR